MPTDLRAAIPVQHTPTVDSAWDAGEQVKSIPGDAPESQLRKMYAWVDGAADATAKGSYRFPHHMVSGGHVGAASLRACSAAIGVLNGGRGGTNIPDADRQGVYNHLAAHLKDAGRTPPELNSVRSEQVRPGGMERRYFPFTGIQVETRSGTPAKLRGHSAVFNTLSENLGFFRETIRPGAFRKTIANDDVRALFNHNPDHVLGRTKSGTLALSEDDRGLYMEVDPPDTPMARGLIASIKRGDIDQQSFGFQVPQGGDRWYEEDGLEIRELIEIQLFDVSPVTFPAYTATDVQVRHWVEQAGLEWEGLAPVMVRCFRGLDLDRSERRLISTAIDRLPILRGWVGAQAPSRSEPDGRPLQAQWLDLKRRRRGMASRKGTAVRQMTPDPDEDPGALAQAIDQTLDEALEEHAAGNDDQGWQLVTAACATVDSLLEALNVPDSDEAGDGDMSMVVAGT